MTWPGVIEAYRDRLDIAADVRAALEQDRPTELCRELGELEGGAPVEEHRRRSA